MSSDIEFIYEYEILFKEKVLYVRFFFPYK